MPKGCPAGGRGVRCGWIMADQRLGAYPGYSMRFWIKSKTAVEQQSQVLQ